MNKKKWVYLTSGDNRECSPLSKFGYPRLVSLVLSNRNINSEKEAKRFFSPDFNDLDDPWLLPDISMGVERLVKAVEAGEKIVIYGDYDVDGCTGTALLYSAIKKIGGRPGYYLPHRINEGYGLNMNIISEFIKNDVNLIITIDCGTSNLEEIAYARKHGVDVIVLDHHEPDEDNLPGACALINPKLKSSKYPFSFFAGVGVGFKFIQALSKHFDCLDWKDYLGFAALGTIADIVPMVGENRAIAFLGLKALNKDPGIGLKALMNISGTEVLDTNGVLFRIAPRINALGRMDNASCAVELLMSSDIKEAMPLARIAEEKNNDRKFIQNNIMDEALFLLGKRGLKTEKTPIVLASEKWHIGVLGIVASKLVEKFYRPVYLMMVNGCEAKGSARGIEGFSIFDSLAFCQDILTKHGGHALAGGFSLDVSSIEKFREKLEGYVEEKIDEEVLSPVINIEGEAFFSEIDLNLAEWFKSMEPFGIENPVPFFSSYGVKVINSKFMGRDEEHFKLILQQGDITQECVGFKMGKTHSHLIKAGSIIDLVYSIDINYWRNEPILRLTAKDLRPSAHTAVSVSSSPPVTIDDNYEAFSSEEKALVDEFTKEHKVIASFSDALSLTDFLNKFVPFSLLQRRKRLVLIHPLRLEANRHYIFLKSYLASKGIKVFLLTGTLNSVERERMLETLKADFPCLIITTFDYLCCYKSFFLHHWKNTDIAVIDENLLDYASNVLIQLDDLCHEKGFLFLTLNSRLKSSNCVILDTGKRSSVPELFHTPSFLEDILPDLKGNTVMFFSGDKEAREALELINKKNISAELLPFRHRYEERIKILRNFKSGRIKNLLCSSNIMYDFISYKADNIVFFDCPFTWNEFLFRMSLGNKVYITLEEKDIKNSLALINSRVPDRGQLIKCYQILRSNYGGDMMNLLSSQSLSDEIGPELLRVCLIVFEEIGLYRVSYQRSGYSLKLLDHKKKLDLFGSPCYLECLKLREHFDKVSALFLDYKLLKDKIFFDC